MPSLLSEVDRFRQWAAMTYPPESRFGEWECNYLDWQALYEAMLSFVAARPFNSWSVEELDAVLYAIARDNEDQ